MTTHVTAPPPGPLVAVRGRGQPKKDPPAYRVPQWRETPPEDIAALIERCAAEHMSLARIAIELGTSAGTLRRWRSEDPLLDECYERGKARAEHELYMQIVDGARNGEKLNMCAVYALNNRHGWRTEQSDGARFAVSITLPAPMSAEEYRKALEHTVVASTGETR